MQMKPTDYTNYGLAQELRRMPTHHPEIVTEVIRRLLESPWSAALTSPAKEVDWDVVRQAVGKCPAGSYDLESTGTFLTPISPTAQVGGDEREAFERFARGQTFIKDCQRFDKAEKGSLNEYGHWESQKARHVWLAALDYACAALSADGGEDKRDAERYRIVRHKVCIVGDAFHIINLRPTYVAPDAGAELDAVVDAIAAKAKGEARD
ncbi:hypothetical protein C266_13919 [Pandoraea sp. SD6-2]|nr:hypothetical protein C266_13919 [Pandoraea sp. SD6-2]